MSVHDAFHRREPKKHIPDERGLRKAKRAKRAAVTLMRHGAMLYG